MASTLIIPNSNFSANALAVSGQLKGFVSPPWSLSITSNSGGTKPSMANQTRITLCLSNNNQSYKPILIPNGKTITIYGLKGDTGEELGLEMDYCYYSTNDDIPNYVSGQGRAAHLVGTASNFVTSNYFPINKNGNASVSITNNYGADYYFAFLARNLSNSTIDKNAYTTFYYTIQ